MIFPDSMVQDDSNAERNEALSQLSMKAVVALPEPTVSFVSGVWGQTFFFISLAKAMKLMVA